MHLWVLYSILSAIFWALSDALAKKSIQEENNHILKILWFRFAIGVPFILPLLVITGIPQWSYRFLQVHLAWIPLETTAVIIYLIAIKVSPLALTLPYLSFTPVFLIFTGSLIVGEKVNIPGTMGILLVVAGALVLQGSNNLIPMNSLRKIIKEKGSLLMLIVAFIYSFTSIFGKIMVTETDPLYFSVHYLIVMAIVTSPFGITKWKSGRTGKYLLLSGLSSALSAIFHMLAIYQAMVAYMIALKRTSGVFGVLFGYLFFRERDPLRHTIGALIMIIGAIIISII